MNCEEYQLQVSKLLDNALEKSKAPEVFSHLGGCDRCREFFDSTLHIRSMLRSTKPLPMTETMDRKVLELAKSHPYSGDRGPLHQATSSASARVRTALALAILVLITGLFWSVTLPKENEDRFDLSRQAPQIEVPNRQP